MAQRPTNTFRSGDPLFAFDPDLTIVSWNRAAEELTGVPAGAAVGRHCWEVLGGHDERGNLVCHAGCSTARLAREGWPVACQCLLIKAREGTRRVAVSTVVEHEREQSLFVHVMVPHRETPSPGAVPVVLTSRQQQVLRLDFEMMGVGLAVAVLLDATIVRAVLLPASMTLLGDWNWYWLQWLPQLHREAPAKAAEAEPRIPSASELEGG